MSDALTRLHQQIAACTLCADALPLGPRPVVQFAAGARILIVGQAPGTRVHASGIPWDDDSGTRLRAWMGIDTATFYDPQQVAIMPMGFCYPGKGKSGDLPPLKACAPHWHAQILAQLPPDRLTLLVGSYAQAYYLPRSPRRTLTEQVHRAADLLPTCFALPHPSWRSTLWMRRHPWFEQDTLPLLRQVVHQQLTAATPPSTP